MPSEELPCPALTPASGAEHQEEKKWASGDRQEGIRQFFLLVLWVPNISCIVRVSQIPIPQRSKVLAVEPRVLAGFCV